MESISPSLTDPSLIDPSLIEKNGAEVEVIARLSALLFNLDSEEKPSDKNAAIAPSVTQAPRFELPEIEKGIEDGDLTSLFSALNSHLDFQDNLSDSLATSEETSNQNFETDALQQLQTLLVEPGLEDLAATVNFLAQRLEQVESVVGDPRLNLKLEELESQLADRISKNQNENQLSENQLKAKLEDLAQHQRNLPLEINRLDRQIAQLESHISTPESLLKLILPIMGELLKRKVSLSQAEMCEALVPIVDSLIRRRTEQDRSAMSEAIAILLPDAIAQAINNFPEQTAKALAPEVALAIEAQIQLDQAAIATALAPQIGSAIAKQIILERDAMVDALYPVIGSTISKYLAEAIRLINQKVENAFSLEGVKRKIRAKMRGVSEAELIFQEAMPFRVRAIFLIHKSSGLIIAEIQPVTSANQTYLESDMIAGMLTAIRSFANDCLDLPGVELDQIEYGTSKILLEIAGYCYLAIAVEGNLTPQAMAQIRRTFSDLIQKYGTQLEHFDGDSSSISPEVSLRLKHLATQITPSLLASSKPPNFLLFIGLILLSAIATLWGINHAQNQKVQQLLSITQKLLAASPELTIYNIAASATPNRLILSGRVPYAQLKRQAEIIALKHIPSEMLSGISSDFQIENQIQVANVLPNPEAIALEVARTTKLWQGLNPQLQVNYESGKVVISGKILTDRAQQISQAFANIPGITSVINTVTIQLPRVNIQILFELESAKVSVNQQFKLEKILQLLHRYPTLNLEITGSSDASGDPKSNQRLALERAESVRNQLLDLALKPTESAKSKLQSKGILAQRLQLRITSVTNRSLRQQRSVKFKFLIPVKS
jgi:outer membrane protein OmpA-like peptidoglycan-associated protein